MNRRGYIKLICIGFLLAMLMSGVYKSITVQGNHQYSWDEDQIRTQLLQEAPKWEEKPINAKIDPVWKAIPGYNGRQLNIEQTLAVTQRSYAQDGQIKYVFKEIEPKTTLEDLGAVPVYKGNPKKKMVTFLINVAWGNEYISPILETLKKENVHATFFLDGSWLNKNADIARKIQTEGHEIANHGYSHQNMSQLSNEKAELEIMKTEQLIQQLLGVKSLYFAPPSGDYDQETVNIAAQNKMKTILWTIDTVDWKKPDPNWIIKKITRQLEPGSMILMHPTLSSSSALPSLIQEIKKRGLITGTVSELLSSKRVD